MGFPIFLVPYVPFRDILRMLEFSEIISISICSQRCHNVTKRNLYKLNEWEICVLCQIPYVRNSEIVLRKGEEKCVILGVSFGASLSERLSVGAKIESNRIGKTLFRVEITPQGYLTSYWPTERIGMFECGKYVADLFQKEIRTIEFCGKSTWLMDLPAYIPQLSISKVVFDTEWYRGPEISLIRVLEECFSEHLEIDGWFEGAPRLIRYGSFRTFRICCGQWMSVRHVTTLRCSHISIEFSMWNSVHANKILRRWVHGGMPRLESFEISILFEIRIEEMLDGLDKFVLLNSSFEGIGMTNRWCTFHQLQIRSKSGLIALVEMDTAEKMFRFAVYPYS
ncbi:unnamed protein product [Caenorhabditis brenneri]